MWHYKGVVCDYVIAQFVRYRCWEGLLTIRLILVVVQIVWAVSPFPMVLSATLGQLESCLLYTSPSPRDATLSRMPSSA